MNDIKKKLANNNGTWLVIEIPDISSVDSLVRANYEEWVARLRSKKYRQHIGQLRSNDGDGFCCLGVYSDMATEGVIKGVKAQWRKQDNELYVIFCNTEGNAKISQTGISLTQDLRNTLDVNYAGQYGLRVKTSFCKDENKSPEIHRMDLAGLNDQGFSFETIADVIEIAINGGANYEVV